MSLREYNLIAKSIAELGTSRPEPHLLLELSLAVSMGMSVGDLVDGLYDPLARIVPFDRVGLAFTADGRIEFKVVKSREPTEWRPDSTSSMDHGVLGPVIKETKVVVIRDLQAYVADTEVRWPLDLLAGEEMSSAIILPLCREGKTAGAMVLASRGKDVYGPQHIELLGAIAALLGTAFERAMLIESLKKATRELLEVDRLKTNFLSTMSHELRTPLSQVLGFAYSLEDAVGGPLSLGQHDDVRKVIEGAERLRALLDDLFEFTALASDQVQLARVPVDLAEIAREVYGEMEPAFREAGLTATFESSEGDLRTLGDPPRVARAVRVILDNARQFTRTGGRVSVRVSRAHGEVRVRVEDTGIGIAKEELERIFKFFYQVEGGPARERGGTGIQLALAKLIMEAHGGALEVESEPGKGSVFCLAFPPLAG